MVFIKQPVHSIFHKTQFCGFFKKGKCTRGGMCKFAHSQEELQPAPDFKFTKMCQAMHRTGVCGKGDACTFAHCPEELCACVRAAPCRGSPAAEVASPPVEAAPAPPPPLAESPSAVMIMQVPAQAVKVIPTVSMQVVPAPVLWLCSSAELSAASHTQVSGGVTRAESKRMADPLKAVSCKPDEDEDDDDLELQLPSNSWSRLSTEEGPAEPAVEFNSENSEDQDWEYVQVSMEAAGSNGCAVLPNAVGTAGRIRQPGIATALSHRYVVKKTFIEFDDEDVPSLGIRRLKSTGGDLSLAL